MWGCIILTLIVAVVPAILITRLGGIWIAVGNGFMSVFLIGCAWVSIANQVKRWHDLGRSGWMILISFIPFVGFVANVICLGFLRGQVAANRFGAPPGQAAPDPAPPIPGEPQLAAVPPTSEPPLLVASARRPRRWKGVIIAGVSLLILGPLLAAVVFVSSPQGTLTARREWLRAMFGSAEAQQRLAWRYREGDGLKQDYAAAAAWFERAAAKGLAQAQYDTAVLYWYGIGRPLDPDMAKSWLERAARQEYGPASTLLGLITLEQGGDRAAALSLWAKAVAQGDAHAEALLGSAYLEQRGEGIEDLILALYWMETARRDGIEPVAGQLQHIWATVPEEQLEAVTAEVFRRLEAGSPAPLATRETTAAPAPVPASVAGVEPVIPNVPVEVTQPADPAPPVESAPPENNLAAEVQDRLEGLEDYADLSSLYDEKNQADAAWAESDDGKAVAGYLQMMRDDAGSVEVVPVDSGGEALNYAIAGTAAHLDGVQFDRLKGEVEYRVFIAETIAHNIAGAPKPLRIAELLKESRQKKGAPSQ